MNQSRAYHPESQAERQSREANIVRLYLGGTAAKDLTERFGSGVNVRRVLRAAGVFKPFRDYDHPGPKRTSKWR